MANRSSGRSAPLPQPASASPAPSDAEALRALRALFAEASAIARSLSLPVPDVSVGFGELPAGAIAKCVSVRDGPGLRHRVAVSRAAFQRLNWPSKLSVALHELLHAAYPLDGHSGRWAEGAALLNGSGLLRYPIRVTYPTFARKGT